MGRVCKPGDVVGVAGESRRFMRGMCRRSLWVFDWFIACARELHVRKILSEVDLLLARPQTATATDEIGADAV